MFTKVIIIYSFTLILKISANFLFPEHANIFSHSKNPEKSYFGFSVQLYSSASTKGSVIVGSPKSTDIYHESLDKPGAIFRCSLDTQKCQQLDFDSGKDDTFLQGKNNSYLGYSLDIDSTTGKILACAPRWTNYYMKQFSFPKIHGMCYINKDSNNVNISSFADPNLQFHLTSYNYIFGEGGFASSLIKDDTVIYSALGLWNWTGSIIQYKEKLDPLIVTPKNVRSLETYSYFGYSLSYGQFNTSDLDKIFYIIGAPRTENLTGKVYVSEQIKNFHTFPLRYEFPGRQFGEYFGASIAVADINGDNIDDIIIGAPMHSLEDREEIGCIYPYITLKSDVKLKFKKVKPITGSKSRERFGTAISSLGDINKDGYGDIAVGAPYYEETGAVYIYFGQKDNNLKFDQIIEASKIDSHLRGFGFSLSRGTDIDNNESNDLAIGSYLSGHVVVVKSKPIVDVKVTLAASIKEIAIITQTFKLTNCVQYTTKQTVPNNMTMKITITSNRPQIRFNRKSDKLYTSIINYKKDLLQCENITIEIVENLSSDVKFTFSYEIDQGANKEFCALCPIENNIKEPTTLTIHLRNGCGDSVCIPVLKLSADIQEKEIIIGSETELKIKIENSGENAFGVQLDMQFTPVEISVEPVEKTCVAKGDNIHCTFNKPLLANNQWEFIFKIKTGNIPFDSKLFNLSSIVSSHGEGNNTTANILLEKPLNIDLKYNTVSKSEPENILISSNKSEHHITHIFTIENSGITKLDSLDTYVSIPTEYNNEKIVKNIKVTGCYIQNEDMYDANYETMSTELDNIINLTCKSTQTQNIKCQKIKCELRDDSEYPKIKVSYDVNITMFLHQERAISLTTSLEIDSNYLNLKLNATTKLNELPKTGSMTLYVVIGIIVGVSLILIIVLILYKLGFFIRKRPPQFEESTLLEEKQDAENVSDV